ncbi:MAG: universal stress protein [Burkholderiales bacterium]|nr:universal stress protein [Burkholderiales bacterium]
MQKLLVPVDGSENALRAVRHAMAMAKLVGGASIHLAYAHEPPRVYGEIAVYVPAEKIEAFQREHSDAILAAAETILKDAGVPHTKDVLIGDVAPAIVEHAKKLRCTAIVMGTRGMTSIGNLVMGSIATKVIHLADLPVTLVK